MPDRDRVVVLPHWDCQGALTEIFKKEKGGDRVQRRGEETVC